MTDRLDELRASEYFDLSDDEVVESTVDLENALGTELGEEARKALEKFEREANAINQAIAKIRETVENIQHKYLLTLDEEMTQEEYEKHQGEISSLIEANEKRSGAIRKRLKRIAEENKVFAAENSERVAEIRIRANQHQNMTRNFMSAMQLFQEALDHHRDNVKAAMVRRLRGINPEATRDEIEQAVKSDNVSTVVDGSTTLSQLPPEEQARLVNGLAVLRSRNNDIKALEGNIVALHQLFVDMQLLVEAQGEIINNIEYNIQTTKGETQAAHQELVQAHAHQKSARKKKICIFLLIIAIVIAILVPVLVTQIPKWFPGTQIPGVTPETPASPSPSAVREKLRRGGQYRLNGVVDSYETQFWRNNVDVV